MALILARSLLASVSFSEDPADSSFFDGEINSIEWSSGPVVGSTLARAAASLTRTLGTTYGVF